MTDTKDSFDFTIMYAIPEYLSRSLAFEIAKHIKGTPVYVHKITKKVGAYVSEVCMLQEGLVLKMCIPSKTLEEAFKNRDMALVARRFYFIDPLEYLAAGMQ